MWIPGLAAAALVARTTVGVAGAVATVCAVLLLAAVPDWSYWLWGGLENGLFGLVCLLLATASARYVSAKSGWRSGAELALATILVALTRADGIWALGITAAACFLQRGRRFRAWPLAVSIFVLSDIHGIRFGFTGLLFPTPTYAKMSISLETALRGLSYLTDFGSQSLLHGVFTFVLPAVGVTVLTRALIFVKRPSRFVDLGSATPWALAVAMCIDASTIAVGGDWDGILPIRHSKPARQDHHSRRRLGLAFLASARTMAEMGAFRGWIVDCGRARRQRERSARHCGDGKRKVLRTAYSDCSRSSREAMVFVHACQPAMAPRSTPTSSVH